jgi:TetR/AcrR family tetracycline transcriptional repressor
VATRTRSRDVAPALSRERIVHVATRLLVEEGLSGLTMRRLARELGVSAMTTYRYFHDKDELIDAVVDGLVSSEGLPEPGGSWRDRVRELMSWLWAELGRYPALVSVRLERPFLSPGALQLTESVLQALVDAGFNKAEALRVYRTLLNYTFGSAAFGPGSDAEERRRRTGAALMALPPQQFPILSSSIGEAAATARENPFHYGLERLLDGLEAALRNGEGSPTELTRP